MAEFYRANVVIISVFCNMPAASCQQAYCVSSWLSGVEVSICFVQLQVKAAVGSERSLDDVFTDRGKNLGQRHFPPEIAWLQLPSPC